MSQHALIERPKRRLPRIHLQLNGFVIALVLVAAAAVFAWSRIEWSEGVTPSSVPWWFWTHLAVYVFGHRRAVRRGRWIQAAVHSYKGVFHGHAALIKGRK